MNNTTTATTTIATDPSQTTVIGTDRNTVHVTGKLFQKHSFVSDKGHCTCAPYSYMQGFGLVIIVYSSLCYFV